MAVAFIDRLPEQTSINFGMLKTNREGVLQANRAIKDFFGEHDYDRFKEAHKKGDRVYEEERIVLDRRIEDKVKGMFNGRGRWYPAMALANQAVNYAQGIFFPEQDRRGTLTNKIQLSDNRPSTALDILTAPSRDFGPLVKFDQGRQLALMSLGADLLSNPDIGRVLPVLGSIDAELEERFLVGKKGQTDIFSVLTAHEPGTNKLLDVRRVDDFYMQAGIWVKALDFPTRTIAIRDESGDIMKKIPALVEYDEKDMAAAVIKAQQRSLKKNPNCIQGQQHVKDGARFRVVVMGGRGVRDEVTAYLEKVLRTIDGVKDVRNDDNLQPQGDRKRPVMNKRWVDHAGLINGAELQVYALPDYLTEQFESGIWSPKLNMHDGPDHDHYKLGMIGDIAPYLWPYALHKVNLAEAQRVSSFEFAGRLARKLRVHPDPYAG